MDRNFAALQSVRTELSSLPSRGAWIEMYQSLRQQHERIVAPLAGSVDRNPTEVSGTPRLCVAPLAGSVDRNISRSSPTSDIIVAPLAGSVDRNSYISRLRMSLMVAPLAGSVDRNGLNVLLWIMNLWSLPSRGAWIEMPRRLPTLERPAPVAPLAGSVDRNRLADRLHVIMREVAPLAGSVDRNTALVPPYSIGR